MKKLSLIFAVVAALGLSDIPEAEAFPSIDQLLPGCFNHDRTFLPEAKRGQNRGGSWHIYQYFLLGEEVELALPSELAFTEADDQLVLQFQKGNENFLVSVAPSSGGRPDPEHLAVAFIDAIQDKISEYGGEIGDPRYYHRGELEAFELIATVPTNGGTLFIKTVCFISDENVYSLTVTYLNSPSLNARRFLDTFRLAT